MLSILARVRLLIVQIFDQLVISRSEKGAQCRTDPIDPVFMGKRAGSYRRAKGTGRIEGAACEKDAFKMGKLVGRE